jgi:hypothetical protein
VLSAHEKPSSALSVPWIPFLPDILLGAQIRRVGENLAVSCPCSHSGECARESNAANIWVSSVCLSFLDPSDLAGARDGRSGAHNSAERREFRLKSRERNQFLPLFPVVGGCIAVDRARRFSYPQTHPAEPPFSLDVSSHKHQIARRPGGRFPSPRRRGPCGC